MATKAEKAARAKAARERRAANATAAKKPASPDAPAPLPEASLGDHGTKAEAWAKAGGRNTQERVTIADLISLERHEVEA